jgi:uncharacterized RDD family membrane protein YckC
MINSKSNNQNKNSITQYLHDVESYFPFPKKVRLEATEVLKHDIEQVMGESGGDNPVYVFGHPREVARNFSSNYNWNYDYVGFRIRFFAYIIDVIIGMVLFYICARLLDPLIEKDLVPGIPSFVLGILLLTPFWLLSFNHQIILEVIFSTSIGKRIFGLIVCDYSGVRISWEQAIVRNVSKFIPGLVAIEILVGPQTTKYKQRYLDLSAKTLVVKMNRPPSKTDQDIIHKTEPSLEYYFQQIEKWFQYPKETNETAMQYLKQDVQDSMKNSDKINPDQVFGLPYDVAKNFSRNYDWKIPHADFNARTIAYAVDLIFSVVFFFFWLRTINIIIFPIQFGLIEPIRVNLAESVGFGYFLVDTFLYAPLVFFILFSLWFICLGHPMVFEGLFSTSIGKSFFGIIVCDQSGIRITWKQAFLRNTTKLLPGLVLFEVIAAKMSPEKEDQRRAMDKIADTDVKKIFEKKKLIKQIILFTLFVLVFTWLSIFVDAINYSLWERF